MKLVIMILIFNPMIVTLLSLLPLVFMSIHLLMWRVVKFLSLWVLKTMLYVMVILLNPFMMFLEIIYEEGTYALTYLNNIKFLHYVFIVLKLHLFCLPMLVDSCSHKLFDHKIPMHRKWVRLKCA